MDLMLYNMEVMSGLCIHGGERIQMLKKNNTCESIHQKIRLKCQKMKSTTLNS